MPSGRRWPSRFPVERERAAWEDRALLGLLALGLVLGLTTNLAYTRSPGLLMLLAGLLWSRCHIEVIDIVQPEKKRLREALDALPEMAAHPGDHALFFGSSLVWNGFVPDIFDARLRERGVELASFNLGFGGLNPAGGVTAPLVFSADEIE